MPKLLLALLAVPLAVAGCSSNSKPAPPAAANGSTTAAPKTIDVKLTDDGCEPRSIAASAGPTTFKVSAAGTGGVTEFEVLDGNSSSARRARDQGQGRQLLADAQAGQLHHALPGRSQVRQGDAGGGRPPRPAGGHQRRPAQGGRRHLPRLREGRGRPAHRRHRPLRRRGEGRRQDQGQGRLRRRPLPLRGHRAHRRELRRSRSRHRRPGGRRRRRRVGRLPPPREGAVGRQQPGRHGPGGRQARGRRRQAPPPDRHHRARAGPDRQRRRRSAQRGVDVEDHR